MVRARVGGYRFGSGVRLSRPISGVRLPRSTVPRVRPPRAPGSLVGLGRFDQLGLGVHNIYTVYIYTHGEYTPWPVIE
jgi:hypothetical protein